MLTATQPSLFSPYDWRSLLFYKLTTMMHGHSFLYSHLIYSMADR